MLQYAAVRTFGKAYVEVCCSVLQCVAVCCSVSQWVAAWCSVYFVVQCVRCDSNLDSKGKKEKTGRCPFVTVTILLQNKLKRTLLVVKESLGLLVSWLIVLPTDGFVRVSTYMYIHMYILIAEAL